MITRGRLRPDQASGPPKQREADMDLIVQPHDVTQHKKQNLKDAKALAQVRALL